jgi:hypothetical protein
MPIKRLTLLLLAAFAAGCSELPSISPEPDQDTLPGEPVQLVRLQEYFPHSGFPARARLVVESQADWEAVWQRLWQDARTVPAPPAVDFEREVVLVAAMGTRPSGGYQIQLQQAAAQSGAVVVRVAETSPGGGCIVTFALTAPVDIARLPRTALPIEFQTVKAVHEC